MADAATKTLEDREVWMRCFAGAITGLLSGHQATYGRAQKEKDD